MFVVYLTMYMGDKLPRWYIGSSSKERVLSGYTGSVTSKKWSNIYYNELKENRHLFKTRILSSHETRDEAVIEEHRLQRMHKVVTNILYFNESYATKNGCFTMDKTGELNPMFGQGEKVKGKKNGRHRDIFKGDLDQVSKNISEGLRKTPKNKKGNNPASKKYYIHDTRKNAYIDIPKGFLREYCDKNDIGYNALYLTLFRKKPINHTRKYKNGVGFQLFEGSVDA